MNKYIRSTGLYAFLFPASRLSTRADSSRKNRTTEAGIYPRERRLEIYLELFIVFLTAGALVVMDNEIFI